MRADQKGLADRVAGALLGVHVGDALGAALEFSSWSAIRQRHPDGLREIVGGGPFGWPPGHATDDTDLTRAVLLAYLDAAREPGGDVVRCAADYMLAWLDGDWAGREPGSRPRDVGGATRRGWAVPAQRRSARQARARPCGKRLLMRCIPTGLAVTGRDRRISVDRDLGGHARRPDRGDRVRRPNGSRRARARVDSPPR
jgi:hypothetical protein